ncbi:MAG: hypothetical protein M3O30_10935 [Planctomycetota bacterium]|nr:hypothetical protein [Planctomycetota bacterium]
MIYFYNYRKLTHFCCALAISLLMFSKITNVARAGAPSSRDEFIFLGKVLKWDNPPHPHEANSVTYTYTTKVLLEYHGRIPKDSIITIAGRRDMAGTRVSSMPSMVPGAVFLMSIYAGATEKEFKYVQRQGRDWRPIGVELPCAVDETEIPQLEDALIRFGETSKNGQDIAIDDKDALVLLGSDNYFLWALGATAIARDPVGTHVSKFYNQLGFGTPQLPKVDTQLNEAFANFVDPIISLRQAVWIVHCLREEVPLGKRQGAEYVDFLLDGYLERYVALKETTLYIP